MGKEEKNPENTRESDAKEKAKSEAEVKENTKPEERPEDKAKVEEKIEVKEGKKPEAKPETKEKVLPKPDQPQPKAESLAEKKADAPNEAGKGKKRKKINLMSPKEIESKLKDVQEKMGSLKSRYARQLLRQKQLLESEGK